MTKVLLILLGGLVCEALGVVLLKEGIDSICKGKAITLVNIWPVFLKGVLHPKILLGVFFEAAFFGCLLFLMSRANISLLWPLTSLSFVFTTLVAVFYLKEHVSSTRWLGVALIMVGVAFISWDEKKNERNTANQTPNAESAPNPGAPH